MDIWGVVRQGGATREAEAALRAATWERGWAYLGTLERQGLGLDSVHDLVERAGGRSLLVEGAAVLAEDPREAALRLLVLEGAGLQVSLVGDGEEDALELALAAAREAATRAPAIRAGMQARALRGLALGKLPYGYLRQDGGQPLVDPDEAATVLLIFDLCLQNRGIRAIVAELNSRGLRTRRGGEWSMITVRDMLRNRFYTGTYSRFGMRVAGNHPEIIARSVFNQAQERLDVAARRSGHGRGEPFLLAGLLYCGSCGSRMIGVTRRQSWRRRDGTDMDRRYRYYQCGGRVNRGLCAYHTRRAADLDQEVLARLSSSGQPPPTSEQPAPRVEALRRLVRKAVGQGTPAAQVRQHALALRQGAERNGLRRRIERVTIHEGNIEVRLRR